MKVLRCSALLAVLSGCTVAATRTPPSGPPTAHKEVQVVAGTYGGNCGQARGNVTDHLVADCEGRDQCLGLRLRHRSRGHWRSCPQLPQTVRRGMDMPWRQQSVSRRRTGRSRARLDRPASLRSERCRGRTPPSAIVGVQANRRVIGARQGFLFVLEHCPHERASFTSRRSWKQIAVPSANWACSVGAGDVLDCAPGLGVAVLFKQDPSPRSTCAGFRYRANRLRGTGGRRCDAVFC